jgi:hypothetical protein
MISRIRIGDECFERDAALVNPRLQVLIETARENNLAIECLCRGDNSPIPLYSRRLADHLILCRMPDSGLSHHADCVFHGETTHSHAQTVQGERVEAIEEDEAGITHIRLAAPLTIVPIAERQDAKPNADVTQKRSPPKPSITELGLLRYLWHVARFNRWYPNMAGKRSWATVAYHLGKTAQSIDVRGVMLSDRMLVVPARVEQMSVVSTFVEEQEITAKTDVFLLIGLVKRVEANNGHSYIAVQNLRERLWFPDDVWRRARTGWQEASAAVEQCEGQCVVIAGVTINERGYLKTRYASFMAITKDFLPFVTGWEAQLMQHLVDQNRSFAVRLTPDDITAGIALIDTAEKYERLAIVPRGGVAFGDTARWVWNQNLGNIPALPPIVRGS